MSEYSESFYKRWAPIAQAESKRSGIPASIILAQGMLESRSGKGSFLSELSSKSNNFFGIKIGNNWNGLIHTTVSDEWENGKLVPRVSGFRKYSNPIDSWKDHTDFLLDNPRYRANGVFASDDPTKVAQSLQNAGYAGESKVYASQLMDIIKGSNLTQYDKPVNFKEMTPAELEEYGRNLDGNGTIVGGLPPSEYLAGKVNDVKNDIKDAGTKMFMDTAQSVTIIIAYVIIAIVILFLIFKMVGGSATDVVPQLKVAKKIMS